MNGFLNGKLNKAIQKDVFKQISEYIIFGCENVRESHERTGVLLANDENTIRSVLLNEFLDADDVRSKFGMQNFLFEPESSENYDPISCKYVGRTDIKVLLQPDSFKKRTAYFIIECKRIDGQRVLNDKYIDEGVNRFVTKKYSSFYGKNIMLAFVVKDINIKSNTIKIEQFQNRSEDVRIHGKFELVHEKNNMIGEYTCTYCLTDENIDLTHIFFNFSNVIK